MLDSLLIATTNPGKRREFAELLVRLPVTLVWPDERGLRIEVEETGDTFEENARLKALAYAQASGLWALADDSGLEVDALGGAPGVHTARYAGPEASDAQRYGLLLARMREVPSSRRGARFRCAIVVAAPDGRSWATEGACEGMIAQAPSGAGGFGYDPVFYMPEWGCTMADLPAEIKNRVSHRARAAQAMRRLLLDEIIPHG